MGWISERLHQYVLVVLIFSMKVHEKVINYFTNTETETSACGYEDLTPTENADADGKYSDLLKWALSNPKIKNIALTGTYGSGKSSILRTFEKNNSDYQYLSISSASFKEKENSNKYVNEKGSLDFSNEIEKNILLQLFYKVKNRDIPFSRFNKVPSRSFRKFVFAALEKTSYSSE